MVNNYLKLSLRSLKINKGYFIINLLGLTIGITSFILIALWIRTETSYDRFHRDAGNIYRVDYLLYEEGILEQHSASGSTCVGKELMNAFPEVLNYTRFYRTESLVKYGDKTFREKDILYTESSFFDVFSFDLVKGKRDSVLLAINNAVITDETARKYFGTDDPIGRVITIDGANDFVVSGVVKAPPGNSHFRFDILLSYENLIKSSRYWDNSWVSESVYTYILLSPGSDAVALEAKLPQIPEKFIGKFMKEAFFLIEYKLVRLTDIHLKSSVSNELEINGNYRSVVTLGIVALLVLVIAFINYINLATSRAIEKANEVGVRKVTGALQKDLICQFLTDSVFLNFVALIISLSAVLLLLPVFSKLMDSPLHIDLPIVAILFIFLLVTGSLFTGLLPAIYMSAFSPGLVLKGKKPTGSPWIVRLKDFLVVFQFAVSIALITGTLTIFRQVRFLRSHDTGFDMKGLMIIEGPRIIKAKSVESYLANLQSFRNEITAIPGISSITASSCIPGTEIKYSRVFGIPVEGRNTEKKIEICYTDSYFFKTYGLQLLAGENFTESFAEESGKIILNEAALGYFGFTEAAGTIGKVLRGGDQEVTVKAVINDFNQQSLKELPGPIAFINQPANNYYTLKTDVAGTDRLIPFVEKVWKSHYPENPFIYFFLDDFYDQQYIADRRFSGLILLSSVIAVIIACLGLSGLSAFSIARRTKEIGIRKATGAGLISILFTLNKDFIKLVIIAFIIAVPATWFVMDKWLGSYAYRIDITWWVPALSGAIALLTALATVSIQSLRAAGRNPVDALRYE